MPSGDGVDALSHEASSAKGLVAALTGPGVRVVNQLGGSASTLLDESVAERDEVDQPQVPGQMTERLTGRRHRKAVPPLDVQTMPEPMRLDSAQTEPHVPHKRDVDPVAVRNDSPPQTCRGPMADHASIRADQEGGASPNHHGVRDARIDDHPTEHGPEVAAVEAALRNAEDPGLTAQERARNEGWGVRHPARVAPIEEVRPASSTGVAEVTYWSIWRRHRCR